MSSNTLTTGRNLPPPQSPFVDPKTGALSNDGYQYLNGLLNQIANAIPTLSTGPAIRAAGTTQATAAALTNQLNEVTGGAGGGVVLAPLSQGQQQTIFNRTGGALKVYPPPGASIEGAAANTPVTLANGATQIFYFITTTDIRTED